MSVIWFPTRGLTPIDIRVVKLVSAALSWEVEIAQSAERESFALIMPFSGGDLVFTLMKEQSDYVLTEFPPDVDRPHEIVRGSLEAALVALPRALAASI
jgi:hypothetical protein